MISPALDSILQPMLRPLTEAIGVRMYDGFSPISLFTASEKGYIYDNNDLTSFYLDSAGTTQATVNGLVGLQLDKSGNLALGADFCVNGSFATDTTWTKGVGWAISGGVATKTAGTASTLAQPFAFTAGKAYKITYTLSGRTAGQIAACFLDGTTVNETLHGSNGARSCILIAVTGNLRFGFTADNAFDGSVDNYTIQELPGNHRYQTTTGSKPILRGTPVGSNLVTNGDFASGTTGWAAANSAVVTATGGRLRIQNNVVDYGQAYTTFSAEVGRVYRITAKIFLGTSTSARIHVGNSIGSLNVLGESFSADTTAVRYIVANATTMYLTFQCNTTNDTAYIEVDDVEIVDVSASAVTAPYGLQYDGVDDFLQTASVDFATATSDGLARRNLLTFPSAFDNAAWGKTRSSISANVTTAPDGTTTADKLVEDTTASNNHHIAQAVTTGAGAYTFTIYAKASERFRFILEHSVSPQPQVVFNVQIGEVVSNSGSPTSFSITPVGNGWYRCQMTATLSTSGSFRVFLQNASGNTSYTGDGTSGIFIWGAQLETGSTASTFQDIGTDKMAVVMGVRKLAQGVRQMLVEHNGGSLPGFSIEAPGASGTGYRVSSGGSGLSQAAITGYDDVTSRVTSAVCDIAGDSAILRVNGTAVSTATTDQGTGNYANATLFFGRRNGASLPMNGLDFGGVCIGKTLTATQLANVEKWVSLRTGVTI